MNDTDDSDDDFLAASQVSFYGPNGWTSQNGASTSQSSQNQGTSRRSKNGGASTSQTQKQRASATQRPKNNRASGTQSSQNRETASQQPQNHGASKQVPQNPEVSTNSDRQRQLELLTQGVKLLQDQIVALAQSDKGKDKKEDKKKKPKESHECPHCHKMFASTVTLFRHYKVYHTNLNPEDLGYTVNGSVINIDDSMAQDHSCGICGYRSADKNALDVHMIAVHSKDVKKLCKVCGYKASSKNDLDNHSRIHVNNDSGNNNNVETILKDRMYKCEDCSCFYDDKSKFDEHIKAFHPFEFLCKICNKKFSFKDFENHVKDNHPDVFNDKDGTAKTNVIVEKNVRTQKGRTVIFKCNKCTEKFASKKEAWRHTKMHKKELRRRYVNTNSEETLPVSDILYICEVCDIATDSYDVVVEHSQKHIKNADEQFLTNNCGICSLKFEPICFDKHIDIHYTKKGVNKESFKYLKYKYHLLLTGDWLKFFNMADDVVNEIVSKSIYAYTRSVKMRVVSGKSNTITLYQCMQCDNFVDPSAVRTHALDFDTCVRIPTSFICNVCERSFNTEFACDNHKAVHADMNEIDNYFKIVMFNDKDDREFNYTLDNIVSSSISSQVDAKATEKVIYKCTGCSLCFTLEVSANNHIKTCPSHKSKEKCRICGNLFNMHELPDHYYEHHFSGEIRLIIKDIVPDVILVSDDEDDNKNIKTKQSNNVDGILDDDKEKNPQASQTEHITQTNASAEESNIQPNILVATETAKDDVPMDEDSQDTYNKPIDDGNSNHSDIEVSHDDDSQSTIINGECYNGPNISDVAGTNEIKCVETNLLLNPYYIRNRSERIVDVDEGNEDLRAEIETMTQKLALGEVRVKQENPWYVDEEDTNMNWRRVKRIKESNVTSTDTIIDLSGMMTDDEDEAIVNPGNECTDIHANTNYYTSNSALPSTDGAYSLENITTDNVAHNLRNLQNTITSNSNASNVVEERSIDVLANENSNSTAVLSRRTHVNTDNLKDETKIKIRYPQIEDGCDDSENSEIDEIQRFHDSTMRRFRNGMNSADVETRFMVNNFEIQLSDQKVIVKPNCSIC